MKNNDKKYSANDLLDFDKRFDDLLSQCNDINDIIDKEDNTKYDIVKSYSTYLLFSGAIETLINQAILYKFDKNTLNYFEYYTKAKSNFIDENRFIELLGQNWINNINYSNLVLKLETKYDKKIVANECSHLDFVRIKDIYKECKEIRNKLAHSIKKENIEFSKEICCKFEIIIYVIHIFVDEMIKKSIPLQHNFK